MMFYNLLNNFRRFYSSKVDKSAIADVFNIPLPHKDKKILEKITVYLDVDGYENLKSFKEAIVSEIVLDKPYTCIIKIKLKDGGYIMAGNNFSFIYKDDNSITNLHEIIGINVTDTFSKYIIDEDDYFIDYLHITFMSLSQVLVSEFSLEAKDKSKYKNITREHVNIPLSIHKGSLGEPLIKVLDKKGELTKINYFNKGCLTDFYSLVKSSNKTKTINLDNSYNFYLMNYNIAFILAIKIISENEVYKMKFTFNGTFISEVTDKVVEDNIIRTSGNKTTVFKDFSAIESNQKIKLSPIKETKVKDSFIPNPNIGAIDLETYYDNGLQKVYSLGFKTNLEDSVFTYYISKESYDSELIILNMIDELLRDKYSQMTFYCHNLGGYDIVFILNALTNYNEKNENNDFYNINCVLRDDTVLKVVISKKINDRVRKLTILDSYAMLNSSLDHLCKSYDLTYTKEIFPYSFATKDNLFYVGTKPDKKNYNDISSLDYKKITKENWDFKNESLGYLESDINSLYELMRKVNRQIFSDFGINVTDSTTISGLALKIFLKDFYNSNIPQINKASLYADIKKAYYGGITEVYKPSNFDSDENLQYYDVNSLYPFAALNDMPGLKCEKFNYYSGKPLNEIKSKFGFYNCLIETPLNDYFGLLPVRNKGGLSFPLGKYTGWYFSEELKFAMENGYKVTVLNGYYFDRCKDVFKSYIEKIYEMKSNSKSKVQRQLSKSLLNNLLGRFGISLNKPITRIVNDEKLSQIMGLNKVTSIKALSKDRNIVTYNPLLDSDIIKSNNLDIIKILNKTKDSEIQSLNVASVAISAAVNSYARVYMQRLKRDILAKGGNLYYSDTDSIVTNLKLDNSLVDSKALGKLKLEHEVFKGIFIAPKLYALKTLDGNEIIKCKGGDSKSLSFINFISMLKGEKLSINKTSTLRNWSKGSVIIKENLINLTDKTYHGRNKVYNKTNDWIDTKPLIYDSYEYLHPLLKEDDYKKDFLVKNKNKDKYFPHITINHKVKSLVVHKNYPLKDYSYINEKNKDLCYIPIIKDEKKPFKPDERKKHNRFLTFLLSPIKEIKWSFLFISFISFILTNILLSFFIFLYYLDKAFSLDEDLDYNSNDILDVSPISMKSEDFYLNDKSLNKETLEENEQKDIYPFDSSNNDDISYNNNPLTLEKSKEDFERSKETLYSGFLKSLNDIRSKDTKDNSNIIDLTNYSIANEKVSDSIIQEVRRATVINFDNLDDEQKTALAYLKDKYNKDNDIFNKLTRTKDYSELTDKDIAELILAKDDYYNSSSDKSYLTVIPLKDGELNIILENVPLNDSRRSDPTFTPSIYVIKGKTLHDNSDSIDLPDHKIVMKQYVDAKEYVVETKEENFKKGLEESFNSDKNKTSPPNWRKNLTTPEQKHVETLEPLPVRKAIKDNLSNCYKDNKNWMEKTDSFDLDKLFDEKKN